MRLGTLQAVCTFALSGVLTACSQTSPTPSPPSAEIQTTPQPTAAAIPSRPSPLHSARTLALSDPGGNTIADNEVRSLKLAAEKRAHVDTWILLGRAWIRKARESADPGYYLNAKACADIVLDFAPGNLLAKNLHGQVLLNDHKFVEARDIAEQVLAKDSEDVTALGTLSDAQLELGRYTEAIAAADKMVELKPSLPSYARSSYLAWLSGDVKTALKSAQFAAESGRDPNFVEPRVWVLVQAAHIFWHKGDIDGAEAGYALALKELTEYPPALVGMSKVAMAKGEYKRAVDLLERAHRQSPLVETAWRLGDARAAAGDNAGAAEAYTTVVRDGRKSDPRTLAQFYAVKNRDTEEAYTLIQQEMKERPGIYTLDALAWVLYRQGNYTEARTAIDKATALGTKDAQLLYHAGAVRIAQGERSAGEKWVRDALALNPHFDPTGAPEAKEMLANR
ncbi:MAG: tetratricopeptide repeat protein [Polyangiaceae bacterium]|nr:tetratricopeptide repeat protein [Polyangiaceae bacterium]